MDESSYDLAALAREGNLGVVGQIEPLSRGVIEKWAEGEGFPLLDELLSEYTAGDGEPGQGLAPPSRSAPARTVLPVP